MSCVPFLLDPPIQTFLDRLRFTALSDKIETERTETQIQSKSGCATGRHRTREEIVAPGEILLLHN